MFKNKRGEYKFIDMGLHRWHSVERISLPMQEPQEIPVLFLDWEDPLEKEMATHFSILAWKIPWTEEPGGAPWGSPMGSMGSMGLLYIHIIYTMGQFTVMKLN